MTTRKRNRTRATGRAVSLIDFENAARAWGALGAAAVTVSLSGSAEIVVAVTTDAGTRLLAADDLGQVYDALCGAMADQAPDKAAALGLAAVPDDARPTKAPRPAPGDQGGWQ
jgi:hypothetical protein